MSPTTGWLIMGSWFLLSLIIGLLLGPYLDGDDDD